MKFPLLLLAVSLSFLSKSQETNFPTDWTGDWKGELQWTQAGKKEPRRVVMQLRIHPLDSADCYSWQLIYGSESSDKRPYILVPKDTASGHWVIDEKDGIVLDQYWIANRLCGAFTVQTTTIFNSYTMENGKLSVEFYSISAKPIATTGSGTKESPPVDSYKIGSYQKAILSRQ